MRKPAPQMDARDRAARGSLGRLIDNRQKATLAMLGRTVWLKMGSASGLTLEDFRHEQQQAACGKSSLTICNQGDYKLIKGHYEKLLGRPVDAFRTYVGAEGDGQKRELALAKAHHEIRRLIGLGKLPDIQAGRNYLNAILSDTAKATLETANSRQIWGAIMAMRKLGVKKRGARSGERGAGKSRAGARRSQEAADRVGGDSRPEWVPVSADRDFRRSRPQIESAEFRGGIQS